MHWTIIPPTLARSCCIWTHLSVPAIPAPRAVWPTTGPKGHPSSWLVHPLSAHHHLPPPSSTPCMCMHARSESSHIAAFGHVCLSLPAITWRIFFTTNQPHWPHYSYGWGTFYVPTTPTFHFFNFHAHVL